VIKIVKLEIKLTERELKELQERAYLVDEFTHNKIKYRFYGFIKRISKKKKGDRK